MESVKEIQDLFSSLEQNIHSAECHLALIKKLKEAEMFEELENARTTMIGILTPPQDMWIEWIQDYRDQGKSNDELKVLLLAAVRACPTVDLWEQYAQFVYDRQLEGITTHVIVDSGDSNSDIDANDTSGNSDYDDDLLHLAEGVEATQYIIPESHRVWNIYRDVFTLRLEQATNSSSLFTVSNLKALYLARLRIPHVELPATFSAYSTFVTKYDNANYESQMVAANKIFSETSRTLAYRDSWELKLKQDQPPAPLQTFADYIHWELERPKKYFRPELVKALYERTLLFHHYVAEVWDDYIIFLCEQIFPKDIILSVIERAVGSCPYSGPLWAHRIRLYEYYGEDEETIVELKLTIDGISTFSETGSNSKYDDWKAVTLAWLPYLYRLSNASDYSHSDHLRDECVISLERAASSASGRNDPHFEVELLVIDILTMIGDLDIVRNAWQKLSRYQGKKSIFWLKWFEWEKINGEENYLSALNVIRTPLSRNNIDWPEIILQTFLEYERFNGTAYSTQQAIVTCRRKTYAIAKQRTEEFEKQQHNRQPNELGQQIASNEGQQQQPTALEEESSSDKQNQNAITAGSNVKRSRADETEETTSTPTKKSKNDDYHHRDREHNTIIISNLTSNTSEENIRNFFKDCGEIVSIINSAELSASAVVEFSDEDSVKSALSRDFKLLNENEIRVFSGKQTTVFVTNFAPSVTKDRLTELFQQYGSIVSIRFPSLKYNTNRRFCYIQFSSSESAKNAVEALDGSSHFSGDSGEDKLVVKLSDPSNKQSRSGGLAEGRELYVKGIDFNSMGETEVQQVFAPFGTIEKLRLPPSKRPGRRHDGYGFVTFATAAEARAALDALNNTTIGDSNRVISVSISGKPPTKGASGSTKIVSFKPTGESGSPDANSGNDVRSKTLYVSNLADTINDTQVKGIFEEYGPLQKITLRPDLEGAIVEYKNVGDAGKAALALEGQIVEERPIRLGSSIKPPPKKSTIFVPSRARPKKR